MLLVCVQRLPFNPDSGDLLGARQALPCSPAPPSLPAAGPSPPGMAQPVPAAARLLPLPPPSASK